jgi:glutathione S-transferase
MMILRTAAASPFARKVRIAATLLGLDREIRLEPADTMAPLDTLRRQNALGKLPVLIADGATLFDSRVILEYLDHRAGGSRIIPADPGPRFAALTLQALCDGLMEAALLQVYEGRWRGSPDRHEPKWLEHQAGKVMRALAVLEADPPVLAGAPHVGQIALACALGYLDLRFSGNWRADHKRLVQWLDDFAAAVPAFGETRPPT